MSKDALRAHRKALVIEAEEMQNRRMQIVHMHAVLGRLVTKLVGRSMDDPPLDARAR